MARSTFVPLVSHETFFYRDGFKTPSVSEARIDSAIFHFYQFKSRHVYLFAANSVLLKCTCLLPHPAARNFECFSALKVVEVLTND